MLLWYVSDVSKFSGSLMVLGEDQSVFKKMIIFKVKCIWFCILYFTDTALTSEILSLSSIFLLLKKMCHDNI